MGRTDLVRVPWPRFGRLFGLYTLELTGFSLRFVGSATSQPRFARPASFAARNPSEPAASLAARVL
jgi:hypothetical protein